MASNRAKKPAAKKARAAKRKTPVKTGRPTDYTPELAQLICEKMGEGLSLRQVCALDGMPGRTTIHRWLLTYREFRDQYSFARDLLMDIYADQVLDIADDRSADFTTDDKGRRLPDWEVVQRSRLRVDSRKWIMSKLSPKKYGDKVTTVHSGPNDGPIAVEAGPLLLPEQVAERFAALLDKMETEMGLPVVLGQNPESRIQAMLDTGQPVPPELYKIIQDRNRRVANSVE